MTLAKHASDGKGEAHAEEEDASAFYIWATRMAPKAIKPDIEGYAFYFFGNENNEPRQVHVCKGDGMVKYWLEPLDLADDNGRMKMQEVRRAKELVEENMNWIIRAWDEHFDQ